MDDLREKIAEIAQGHMVSRTRSEAIADAVLTLLPASSMGEGLERAPASPSAGPHADGWVDWSPHEDDIADAISDSMDMDWTSRDGARAVVRYLNSLQGDRP